MVELINPRYGDRYFSADGGLAEALHVFVNGNRMVERSQESDSLRVAETGFGTGLNLLAAIYAIGGARAGDPAEGRVFCLDWSSVESHPLPETVIAENLMPFPEIADILPPYLAAYARAGRVENGWLAFGFSVRGLQVNVRIWHGDVLDMLAALADGPEGSWPDCWVLDGHSPALNPEMWSPAVFRGMARCSRQLPPCGFATYTAAGTVKSGLREAGFTVRRQAGYGRKRHMISGEREAPAGERNA